jgi:hypothetical protein
MAFTAFIQLASPQPRPSGFGHEQAIAARMSTDRLVPDHFDQAIVPG